MLELVDEKYEVKWNGKVYSLEYPSVVDLRELERKKKESDDVDALMSFLENAGLPKDVCNRLKVHHVQALVEGLTKTKKK